MFNEAKDDGSGGDNWNYRSCKAPVKSSPPTNQHPVFFIVGWAKSLQLLGWGTNNVLGPQLFDRSFQKARKFTASIVTSQWDSVIPHQLLCTPQSAYILVDIHPATVERLRLRSSVVYNLCLHGPRWRVACNFTCFIISFWLVFGSNNQGRNHGWKVDILELI